MNNILNRLILLFLKTEFECSQKNNPIKKINEVLSLKRVWI